MKPQSILVSLAAIPALVVAQFNTVVLYTTPDCSPDGAFRTDTFFEMGTTGFPEGIFSVGSSGTNNLAEAWFQFYNYDGSTSPLFQDPTGDFCYSYPGGIWYVDVQGF